jgi:hypothetical protein
LMHLIGKSPHEMSDMELTEHLNELRALQSSAPTRRAAVSKKTTAVGPKKNFDHLFK